MPHELWSLNVGKAYFLILLSPTMGKDRIVNIIVTWLRNRYSLSVEKPHCGSDEGRQQIATQPSC